MTENPLLIDALYCALGAIDLANQFTPTERLDGQYCSIRESVASAQAIVLDAIRKAEGR